MFSSTWASIVFRCSLWRFNPCLHCLNQDWKRGRNSFETTLGTTVERNLNVSLTPSSTSLRLKTAIPCVLSLNLRTRENSRWTDDQVKSRRKKVETRLCIEKISKADWNEGTKERREQRNQGTKEPRNQGTKEPRNEGTALKGRSSKGLIVRLFLPVPYTAYHSKLSYSSSNWG